MCIIECVCKGNIFFAYMQMCVDFYAFCSKKCLTISIQNTMTVAEAMLITRVKNAFINLKF